MSRPGLASPVEIQLARIFHELAWRDRKNGRATGQPQELESEAYLNSTSQGSRSEDAWKDVYIFGRSRPFMRCAGWDFSESAKEGL